MKSACHVFNAEPLPRPDCQLHNRSCPKPGRPRPLTGFPHRDTTAGNGSENPDDGRHELGPHQSTSLQLRTGGHRRPMEDDAYPHQRPRHLHPATPILPLYPSPGRTNDPSSHDSLCLEPWLRSRSFKPTTISAMTTRGRVAQCLHRCRTRNCFVPRYLPTSESRCEKMQSAVQETMKKQSESKAEMDEWSDL